MARKPLRSQLNQIRAWVREGRTDAWIAHQLEVPAAELREFRRRHDLTADGREADEDLRDEIEAEIEAATRVAEVEEEEEEEEAVEDEVAEAADTAEAPPPEDEGEAPEGEGRRRRRRRRRRRGGRGRTTLQATFDHGETDGFGLWLDPAVQDDPAYAEHWKGHREVEVEVEPDRIVIRRS